MTKKELIRLRGNKCEKCGLPPEWDGEPLVLQMHDHKTASPKLLCPNCHSQTDNFAGKGRKLKAAWNKGEKTSKVIRTKISSSMKKLYKNKVNHPCFGKPKSAETKVKNSSSQKSRYRNGAIVWNKDRKCPEISKRLEGQNNPMSRTNRLKRIKENAKNDLLEK